MRMTQRRLSFTAWCAVAGLAGAVGAQNAPPSAGSNRATDQNAKGVQGSQAQASRTTAPDSHAPPNTQAPPSRTAENNANAGGGAGATPPAVGAGVPNRSPNQAAASAGNTAQSNAVGASNVLTGEQRLLAKLAEEETKYRRRLAVINRVETLAREAQDNNMIERVRRVRGMLEATHDRTMAGLRNRFGERDVNRGLDRVQNARGGRMNAKGSGANRAGSGAGPGKGGGNAERGVQGSDRGDSKPNQGRANSGGNGKGGG